MIKISHVIQATSEITGVRIPVLVSQIRAMDVCHPRQMAMYIARELTLQSYPQIGHRFGDRDHTTVIYGCRQVAERLKADPAVRVICDRIAIRAQEIAAAEKSRSIQGFSALVAYNAVENSHICGEFER
ncbi:MAG: helix-turn-helix domain-containing protein [Hyphomicrobiaceae bacterium]|nr:helix-turn-helix domain-containing protein [Hyphomicrobiaceae bacterium]